MNKYILLLCLIGMVYGTPVFAQGDNLDLFKQIDKMAPDEKSSGAPSPEVKADPADQKPPTIITATQKASFDGKLKIAIFEGAVQVKDPQFTLNSDKLTVYFNKENGGTKKEAATKPPAPPSKGDATVPATAPQQGGSIDKIIAEGNVVVQSDRPDSNGGPPVHYVGKAEKLVYNPSTGEAVLSGWPQVQQGINTMVATESSTVIYLNRDGKMRSEGGQIKMEVHDPGPDKTPSPDKPTEVK